MKFWERGLRFLKGFEKNANFYIPGYNYLYNKHQTYWINKLYPKRKMGIARGRKRSRGTSAVRRRGSSKRLSKRQKANHAALPARAAIARELYGGGRRATGQGQILGRYDTNGITQTIKSKRKFSARNMAKKMSLVQPPQIFQHSTATTHTNAVGAQKMEVLPELMSIYGTANNHEDLQKIATFLMDNVTGQTYPANTQYTNKFIVASCRQEVELSNTGGTAANGVIGNAYVDLYEYVCRKDAQLATMGAINLGFGANQPAWTGATVIDSTRLGATPFDLEQFPCFATIKKHTKLLIEPGQSTILSLVGPKNRYFSGEKLSTVAALANLQVAWKGWTRGYVIVVSGQKSTASGSDVVTVSAITTNKYMVKPIATKVKSKTYQAW